MKVGIREAAAEMGVCMQTLRRWEAEGKIEGERTKGGYRRYDLAKLRGITPHKPDSKQTVCYARVSSQEQKGDLARQVAFLESYCAAQGWQFTTIQDLGSGLNYSKKGLWELIQISCQGRANRVVPANKDRLLGFGIDLIFALCEQFGCEVVIINSSETSSVEEELTKDVLEIITVFSARLYGSRSHKNKRMLEALVLAATEVAGGRFVAGCEVASKEQHPGFSHFLSHEPQPQDRP